MNSPQPNARRRDAFTLIEMLVVIAVIGILAAMIIGIFPGVMEKRARSRVRAELMSLTVAIEDFKHDQGFYPADNSSDVQRKQTPLFYELAGTTFDGTLYTPLNGATNLLAKKIQDDKNLLGVDGFVNTQDIRPGASSKPAKNYLPGLKDNEYGPVTVTNAGVELILLLVPYKGTNSDFNPWHYNSSSPVHNPGSFDLWAEIDLGKRDNNNKPIPVTIGNWRQ